MLLHGIDVPTNVRHDNTLARPLASYGPKDRVDCIITNPPFGGMEEDGIEQNFPQKFRTRETADLFLVLIHDAAEAGGRAAIVLPDGTLFGEGHQDHASRKSCWLNATCTPSSGCPTASSVPTPASRPTCCSSPRAADEGDLVLRAPLSAGSQVVQQNQTHPDRRVRSGKGLVGRSMKKRAIRLKSSHEALMKPPN
jgi:hypothetical protein